MSGHAGVACRRERELLARREIAGTRVRTRAPDIPDTESSEQGRTPARARRVVRRDLLSRAAVLRADWSVRPATHRRLLSLGNLLESAGYSVRLFDSAE